MNINPKAKRILIYGDSYTFGKIPGGSRFPNNIRYTGVLQKELGDDYDIIEEGLRGRTLDGENTFFPHRHGFEQFGAIFGSHLPIDLVVLFLGTNDTNSGSHRTPEKIVQGYDHYLERIDWWCDHLVFEKPKVMLIAPPTILEEHSYKIFGDLFKGSEMKVAQLPHLIEKYAQTHDLEFFDCSPVVKVSDVDGIHLDEEGNRLLGEALAQKVFRIFKS